MTQEDINLLVYIVSLVLNIICCLILRRCVKNQKEERFIPRIAFLILLGLAFVPILNILFGLIEMVVVCVIYAGYKEQLIDNKFNNWLSD